MDQFVLTLVEHHAHTPEALPESFVEDVAQTAVVILRHERPLARHQRKPSGVPLGDLGGQLVEDQSRQVR